MKLPLRLPLLLLAVALLGAAGYFCGYRMGCDPVLHEAALKHDSLAWLRLEFHLSPQQFEAIRKLHSDYAGGCDEHCRRIREAMDARASLAARSPGDTAALAEADKRIQDLSTLCEQSIGEHLERVAALMSPDEGARYLAMMRPLLENFDHSGAPDLDFSNAGRMPAHHHE